MASSNPNKGAVADGYTAILGMETTKIYSLVNEALVSSNKVNNSLGVL